MEKPTEKEIEEFKKEWGQTHEEVCSELGYDPVGSDDLLMVDFFWHDGLWINKYSTSMSAQEESIADYLRTL